MYLINVSNQVKYQNLLKGSFLIFREYSPQLIDTKRCP